MDIPHIHPDKLVSYLTKTGLLAVLYVGEGPLQDRIRSSFCHTAKMWSLRGVVCVVVLSCNAPTVRDDRLVALRVPKLRVFRDGNVLSQYTGQQDIETYLSREIIE
jgi:hypothetical protein